MIIAGILGFVARHFANLSTTSTANTTTLLSAGPKYPVPFLILGILSCSNIMTGTNPNLFPLQNTNPQYTVVNGEVMQPVNFHIEPLRIGNLFNSLLGGFGASAARRVVTQSGNTALLPCVYTFSKDYDTSSPYLLPTNESARVRLDSTFQADPEEGWFGLGNTSGIDTPVLALDYFQSAPWFWVAFEEDTSSEDVANSGTRRKPAPVANPLSGLSAFSLGGVANGTNGSWTMSPILTNTIDTAISGIVDSVSNQFGWTGILGNIDPMLFFNISVNKTTYTNFINQSFYANTSNATQQLFSTSFSLTNLSATGFNLTGIQTLPYFNDTNLSSNDQLDDLISNDILTTIHQLSLMNSSSVRLGYWSSALRRYPAVAQAIQIVSNTPWGVLRFGSVENQTVSYMIQTGTDTRLLNVASYPSEGLRRMAFQTMFTKAMLKSRGNAITITPVYQIMPRYISTKIEIPASLLSARILFPFGISFFIPLFVYTLTLEKQSRIFIMMKVLNPKDRS